MFNQKITMSISIQMNMLFILLIVNMLTLNTLNNYDLLLQAHHFINPKYY